MEANVTLMVLPADARDPAALPEFLIYQNGVWRQTPPLNGGTGPDLTKTRESLDQRLREVMGRIDIAPGSVNVGLATLGRGLYNTVVPTDVQKLLDDAARTAIGDEVPVLRVHVHRQLEWIPWEIMYDRTDFLGLRFQVARLPIVPTPPDLSQAQHRTVRNIHNVLGENVVDLAQEAGLFDEWKTTFVAAVGAAAAVQEHRQPPDANGAAAVWPTLNELLDAGGGDIIHITCHGIRDQAGAYWTLNHRLSLPELHHINPVFVEMLNLAATQPLVFGNACASSTGGGAPAGSDGGLSPGLGTAFFAQGALDFVGTFAPITKRIAVGFAREFYRRLLVDGMPIGKALWAVKKHYKDQGERDPSWLFYCLYGPSETRFEMA